VNMSAGAADARATKTIQTFEAMYRARRFDEIAVALQRQGAISGYGQAIGQEATQIGAVLAIEPTDMVFPSYRQPGAALARGVTIGELLAFHARLDYCPWDWRGLRFAPYTVPVGSQLAHAVGWAMADQRDGGDRVTLVFFGDGASSQGETHEAMNFAAVNHAPVIFLCENNGWAISTPLAKQTLAPSLYVRAQAYGMPGFQVDGNDVEAVDDTVRGAVRMARAAPCPILIEAITYRMAGHTTSDDPSLYRTDEEVALWAARDPLVRLEVLCAASGLLSRDALQQIRQKVDHEIDQAVDMWLARNP
jgi:TPP-dependent pyruvate/acetoin dehydrogenase alpha subunit